MSRIRLPSASRPLGWRSRPVPTALSLLAQASWPATTVLLALLVCRCSLTAGFVIMVGRLLAAISRLRIDSGAIHTAWTDFALLAAIWILQQLVQPACTLLIGWLTRRCRRLATDRVLAAALLPDGIGHLEDPATADRISLAQGLGGDAYPPETVVSPLADLLALRLSAVLYAAMLLPVLWWAPFMIGVTWWALGRHVGRVFQAQVAGLEQRAGTMRRASYFCRLGTGLPAAMEVRVWGMAGWLVERFSASWRQAMQELFTRRVAPRAALVWRVGLLVAAYVVFLMFLAGNALDGGTSIAELVVGIQAARGLAGFGWAGDPQWRMLGAVAAIRHLLALPMPSSPGNTVPLSVQPGSATDIDASLDLSRPARCIRFESVSFRYPECQDAAVELDLEILAGESLAIVGENGAGKTTLVKLLAGLYRPQQGRITVDGTDLTELDPAVWRRRLSVVFQDFVRYEFTARENVTFGRPDRPTDPAALAAAAWQAGADEVVAGLVSGWDTVLSRQFGKSELSGGQWQRLALARALYAVQHGARLLILDEPTAQLDALAESRLYGQFLELTRGLTTILISHRFNTVRLADRIVVLAGGKVVEQGSHAELMARDGRYARMFLSQAERLGAAT